MFSKLQVILLLFFVLPAQTQNPPVKDEMKSFPQPKDIKNMLFYVQRTLNTNTIIYELNTNEGGELNTKDPIKFYYINYANHSEVEPVSSVQKKYAYGIQVKLIDKDKQSYAFSFNSFKDKPLYLMQSAKDKKFHVFCYINKQLAVLNNVFVKMESNFVGFPHVREINLLGTGVAKNDDLVETFKP